MRIVFFGSPKFALPALERIKEANHQIVAVVSQPDKQRGRKRKIKPTIVKNYALANGLPIFTPPNLKEEVFFSQYKKLKVDINVVVAYGQIMPKEVISFPKYGSINAHASLLPKYRGAAPITRALLAGDKETGITIQDVVFKLDAGDILLQEKIKIENSDNRGILKEKLATMAAEMLIKTLKLFEAGSVKRSKQDERKVSYAEKIKKEELKINFGKDAKIINNKIRALAPKPGAYVFFGKKRLKILKAEVVKSGGRAGRILKIGKSGIIIATAKDALLLKEVQIEGKQSVNAYEFSKGYDIFKGLRL